MKANINGISTIKQKKNIQPYFPALNKTNNIYGMNKIAAIIINTKNNGDKIY